MILDFGFWILDFSFANRKSKIVNYFPPFGFAPFGRFAPYFERA